MTASSKTSTATTALGRTFRAAYRSELAQRSDGPSPEAVLWAAAHASRALLAERWAATQAADRANRQQRRVHYLSMEFLMGRALGNAVAALGLEDELRLAVKEAGAALPDVLEREADAALGNGGLGRLAACFLDSFATLGLPSFGYGVRYQYGMFAQQIAGGRQVEAPDDWLKRGNPWEIARPELRWFVGFGGRVQADGSGRRWLPAERVIATAYDFIVPGHGTERVSTLRQWHAASENPIDFAAFCRGEHLASGRERLAAD
ncbi:MAG: glycogen/starch/alpha-glucan phosphorylase, partial [Aquincola sp.]|nr:glycogen/starch/alpha-glucan phosphorylase [Aquincola sp.]